MQPGEQAVEFGERSTVARHQGFDQRTVFTRDLKQVAGIGWHNVILADARAASGTLALQLVEIAAIHQLPD
jgi:hypothetical protein